MAADQGRSLNVDRLVERIAQSAGTIAVESLEAASLPGSESNTKRFTNAVIESVCSELGKMQRSTAQEEKYREGIGAVLGEVEDDNTQAAADIQQALVPRGQDALHIMPIRAQTPPTQVPALPQSTTRSAPSSARLGMPARAPIMPRFILHRHSASPGPVSPPMRLPPPTRMESAPPEAPKSAPPNVSESVRYRSSLYDIIKPHIASKAYYGRPGREAMYVDGIELSFSIMGRFGGRLVFQRAAHAGRIQASRQNPLAALSGSQGPWATADLDHIIRTEYDNSGFLYGFATNLEHVRNFVAHPSEGPIRENLMKSRFADMTNAALIDGITRHGNIQVSLYMASSPPGNSPRVVLAAEVRFWNRLAAWRQNGRFVLIQFHLTRLADRMRRHDLNLVEELMLWEHALRRVYIQAFDRSIEQAQGNCESGAPFQTT